MYIGQPAIKTLQIAFFAHKIVLILLRDLTRLFKIGVPEGYIRKRCSPIIVILVNFQEKTGVLGLAVPEIAMLKPPSANWQSQDPPPPTLWLANDHSKVVMQTHFTFFPITLFQLTPSALGIPEYPSDIPLGG